MTNPATILINEPTRIAQKTGSSKDGFLVSFDNQNEAAQQVTRLAARMNASAVSDDEHQNFLAERQRLLDRHFDGTITRKEKVRLEYVRWSLDRIEDAKYGAWLDKLDARVADFHKLAKNLQNLEVRLQSASTGSQPPRHSHRRR